MSDIHKAVDALVCTTRIRLYREDTKRGEWQTLPSLWDQLTTSVRWSGGGTGGGAFGSRPVISTGVVALIIEISSTTTEAAVDMIGTTRGNTPDNIRAIAATITDPDQLTWWTDKLRRWISEARTELRLDPIRPRAARGARCPDCGALHTTTLIDGETVKSPALAITWSGPEDHDHDYHSDDAWKVRAVECRECGMAWWRGDSLSLLIDLMMEANATRETLAGPA